MGVDHALSLLSLLLLLISVAAEPVMRAHRNSGCDEDGQAKLQINYTECLDKFTQKHHENIGKAASKEDQQKHTCLMLKDTLSCGDLWLQCLPVAEVRSFKDKQIAARIAQFSANTDGIRVQNCAEVKEYLESGRGDKMDETTEGACSIVETNEVQTEFQNCSHVLSSKVWNEIKELEETRHRERLNREAETNDINEEEVLLDHEKLDLFKEIRPRLCEALEEIGQKCVLAISRCFTQEDKNMMRDQHIKQMAQYYSSLHNEVDLSDCQVIKAIEGRESDANSYPGYEDDYYDDKDAPDSKAKASSPMPDIHAEDEYSDDLGVEGVNADDDDDDIYPQFVDNQEDDLHVPMVAPHKGLVADQDAVVSEPPPPSSSPRRLDSYEVDQDTLGGSPTGRESRDGEVAEPQRHQTAIKPAPQASGASRHSHPLSLVPFVTIGTFLVFLARVPFFPTLCH